MLTSITIYGKIIITRGAKHNKIKEMEVDLMKLRKWVKVAITIIVVAIVMIGFITIYKERINKIERGEMELRYNGER